MKKLSDFLNRISNWKTLIITLTIYMVFNLVLLKNAESKINELAQKTVGVIDLTFGFNPQKTLQMVAEYGDAGREYYADTEMTTDVLYPIVYTLLFCIILTLLFRNKPYKPFSFINLLPFGALVFDLLENLSIVTLLKSFPNSSETVAIICEIVKMLKWIAFGLVLISIFYGLIMLGLKSMRKAIIFALIISPLLSCSNNESKQNTALPIKGTWQLITGTIIEKNDTTVTDYTKDLSFIKIINDTHFAFLKHELTKGKGESKAFDAGGGTYTLNDSLYTERLEYYKQKEWEGGEFSFTLTLKNDTLTQTGIEKVESTGVNRINTEVYVRFKK
jgi:hypothetical protein